MYGWNSQPHQWQQPRGNAYGWNGQNRQWQQPHSNAYGWNPKPHSGSSPVAMPMAGMAKTSVAAAPGNAYGGNDHQRQWDQHGMPTAGMIISVSGPASECLRQE